MKRLYTSITKPFNWMRKMQMLIIIKANNNIIIGMCLYYLKRNEEAIETFDRSIKFDPQIL